MALVEIKFEISDLDYPGIMCILPLTAILVASEAMAASTWPPNGAEAMPSISNKTATRRSAAMGIGGMDCCLADRCGQTAQILVIDTTMPIQTVV